MSQILLALLAQIIAFFIALSPVSGYREGVIGQPKSFVPVTAQTRNEKTISQLLYRGLFEYDIYGALIPDLAETWSLSDEGLVYTIKIKDNQYWSNGKQITSDDLIYTAFNSEDLKGVATDKVDNLTVRYTLPNKYAPFLNLLTISVMPNNAKDSNSLRPVTSADFRVGRIEKSGAQVSRVVLVTTKSDYAVKKLTFRYYTNDDELVTASQLGEIDGFMSSKLHKDLNNMENYRFPLQGIYFALLFNTRKAPYDDLLLRQKLEKVLPVEKIISDTGIAVQGSVSRSLFTSATLDYEKYDFSYVDDMEDVVVTLTVPDIKKHVQLAKVIKDLWEDKLGLDVVLRKIPPEDLMEKVISPRDFEVLLFGQEVSRDPDRYVMWHSTQAVAPGLNITGFSHVRADRALEEGRNELDPEKRIVHYNEFQKVIYEQVPAIFLYHPYQNFYVNEYIAGLGEKYTFSAYDRFLDFGNWKRVKTN
jgi:peptide/nickel transport system substrate-binding protein